MVQSKEIHELIADVREQVLYMQELGVETLKVDLPDVSVVNERRILAASKPATETMRPAPPPRTISEPRSEISDKIDERPAAGSRLASLPSLSNRPVNKFFDKYNPGEAVKPPMAAAKTSADAPALLDIASGLPEPVETIEDIRSEIGTACTRCKLSELGRSKVVNSIGDFNADLMFVGEAPGADEDAQGEPFVGRAGQLLTDIIRAMGFERKQVFIGNINRCRPPGNRTPDADESVVCKPFLIREIAVVRPKVVVVLGAHAAQNLLETKTPIGKLRGHFHDYLGVKVMPTFHPAYLLRDPHKKREVWDDMKMVRDYLNGSA